MQIMKYFILICSFETMSMHTINTGVHRVCQINFTLIMFIMPNDHAYMMRNMLSASAIMYTDFTYRRIINFCEQRTHVIECFFLRSINPLSSEISDMILCNTVLLIFFSGFIG